MNADHPRHVRAHLETCAQCRASSPALERAEAALAPMSTELSEVARRRMWRTVSSPQPRAMRWGVPIFAFAATIAVLTLTMGPAHEPSPPVEVALAPTPPPSAEAVKTGEETLTLVRAGVTYHVGTNTSFELRALPEMSVVELKRGTVAVDAPVQGTPRAVVVTPNARLSMVGGAFEVTLAEEALTIHVSDGQLDVSEPTGTTIVKAGEALVRGELASLEPEPEDEPEPKPEPKRARQQVEARAELRRARAEVRTDPARAEARAKVWLERSLSPRLEVEALSVLADAARKRGALEKASGLYDRVQRHPAGVGYAEEAMLRRARIQSTLGRHEEAHRILDDARRRHPTGPLAPERKMLEAELLLSAGDVADAARVVQMIDGTRKAADELRVQIATRLIASDVEQACELVQAITQKPATLLSRCEENNP